MLFEAAQNTMYALIYTYIMREHSQTFPKWSLSCSHMFDVCVFITIFEKEKKIENSTRVWRRKKTLPIFHAKITIKAFKSKNERKKIFKLLSLFINNNKKNKTNQHQQMTMIYCCLALPVCIQLHFKLTWNIRIRTIITKADYEP